jgi:hypothetical protein
MGRTSSGDDLDEATTLAKRVLDAFAEEQGGPPLLGEFLEILGSSVPASGRFATEPPFPLVFVAKVKGNRLYRSEPSERVAALNDHAFVEAAALLARLAEHAAAAADRAISPEELATGVLDVLRTGKLTFADVSGTNVISLTTRVPKRVARPSTGDVVAIPAAPAGYHLAVVLADDQTGLALGLLRGVFPAPRVGHAERHRARHVPVYTGKHAIADGTWRVIGHHEELLALFPDPPELYWEAVTAFGDRFGEHGGAGSQDGPKRLISRDEAEAVGLLDGTYQRTFVAEHLQRALDEGRFDNGPVPGQFR